MGIYRIWCLSFELAITLVKIRLAQKIFSAKKTPDLKKNTVSKVDLKQRIWTTIGSLKI